MKGLIDIAAEIAKCEKKLDLARMNLDKIRKIQSQAEYEETIPANVRLLNEDKVCVTKYMTVSTILTSASLPHQRKIYEAEIATIELSKEMFAKLK